jgi:hypothetical protein
MAKTPAAPSTGKKYTPRRYFEEEDTSITCRHCGGIGHMARECLNEKVNPPLGPRPTCHAVTLSRCHAVTFQDPGLYYNVHTCLGIFDTTHSFNCI